MRYGLSDARTKRTLGLNISLLAEDEGWQGGDEAEVLRGTEEKRDIGEGDSVDACELIVSCDGKGCAKGIPETRRTRFMTLNGENRHLASPELFSRGHTPQGRHKSTVRALPALINPVKWQTHFPMQHRVDSRPYLEIFRFRGFAGLVQCISCTDLPVSAPRTPSAVSLASPSELAATGMHSHKPFLKPASALL